MEQEYREARGECVFTRKALLVPLWSRSWHRQATRMDRRCGI